MTGLIQSGIAVTALFQSCVRVTGLNQSGIGVTARFQSCIRVTGLNQSGIVVTALFHSGVRVTGPNQSVVCMTALNQSCVCRAVQALINIMDSLKLDQFVNVFERDLVRTLVRPPITDYNYHDCGFPYFSHSFRATATVVSFTVPSISSFTCRPYQPEKPGVVKAFT